MARKGFVERFFGKILEILPGGKKKKQVPPPPTPTPYRIKSADAALRARRQRILRAKRKQIQYRKLREDIIARNKAKEEKEAERQRKLAQQAPFITQVALYIIRAHEITDRKLKRRIRTRVSYMTEDERREAYNMPVDELRQRAREQYPPTRDINGDRINPYWYH